MAGFGISCVESSRSANIEWYMVDYVMVVECLKVWRNWGKLWQAYVRTWIGTYGMPHALQLDQPSNELKTCANKDPQEDLWGLFFSKCDAWKRHWESFSEIMLITVITQLWIPLSESKWDAVQETFSAEKLQKSYGAKSGQSRGCSNTRSYVCPKTALSKVLRRKTHCKLK
jgi:hypothetical protein